MRVPEPSVLIQMYEKMALIQKTDDKFRSALKSGKLVMPYYSTRGQEVIPSAISVHLSQEDYVCTIYRGVHDMVAKGVPLKALFAELAGRATGTCKGKGGPMHITHPDSGVMVTTGIVGSSMPIANGLALSSKIKKDGRVTIANFGDGASNIGAFHEALNMASVWKLPVIFVCQNNGYAEHTAYAKGTSVSNISKRSVAYDMPGVTVDGNDPIAMWNVAKEAIERARSGGGPTLIEAKTFRFHGHVVGDADTYMDAGEREYAMIKDPIPLYRKWLVQQKLISEDALTKMESAMDDQLNEALAYALESPFPSVEELSCDVFGN